jgi:hypothetical protein
VLRKLPSESARWRSKHFRVNARCARSTKYCLDKLHGKYAGLTPQSMWHAGRSLYVESATKAFKRARTLPAAAVRTTFASCTEVTGARTSLLDPDIAP